LPKDKIQSAQEKKAERKAHIENTFCMYRSLLPKDKIQSAQEKKAEREALLKKSQGEKEKAAAQVAKVCFFPFTNNKVFFFLYIYKYMCIYSLYVHIYMCTYSSLQHW
jgi:hypothetical protein